MTSPEDQAIINAALAAAAKRRETQGLEPLATGTLTTQATAGVLPVMNLKSAANWRAFFHQLVAVLVPIMVTANVVTENMATAWVPFIFAITDNLLSAGNTVDRVRRAIYAAVSVVQAGGLLTTVLTSVAPNTVTISSAVLAVVTAFMARFYTPTTTMVPA